MQIQVTAVHREGFEGIWTPQTLWLSSAPTPVEVLEQDESPPRAPGIAPHGLKIGRNELAALRSMQGLIVSGMDQTNAVEMTAQLAEAHARHGEEIARLKAQIDQHVAEITRLAALEGRVKEQEATIADLRARLSARPAPAQQNGNQSQPRR